MAARPGPAAKRDSCPPEGGAGCRRVPHRGANLKATPPISESRHRPGPRPGSASECAAAASGSRRGAAAVTESQYPSCSAVCLDKAMHGHGRAGIRVHVHTVSPARTASLSLLSESRAEQAAARTRGPTRCGRHTRRPRRPSRSCTVPPPALAGRPGPRRPVRVANNDPARYLLRPHGSGGGGEGKCVVSGGGCRGVTHVALTPGRLRVS